MEEIYFEGTQCSGCQKNLDGLGRFKGAFCPDCDSKAIYYGPVQCKRCGYDIQKDTAFCPRCGTDKENFERSANWPFWQRWRTALACKLVYARRQPMQVCLAKSELGKLNSTHRLCKSCGKPAYHTKPFCTHCGGDMIYYVQEFCTICGIYLELGEDHPNFKHDRSCASCGRPYEEAKKPRSKFVAMALAFADWYYQRGAAPLCRNCDVVLLKKQKFCVFCGRTREQALKAKTPMLLKRLYNQLLG